MARDIVTYRRHNLKPETIRALMILLYGGKADLPEQIHLLQADDVAGTLEEEPEDEEEEIDNEIEQEIHDFISDGEDGPYGEGLDEDYFDLLQDEGQDEQEDQEDAEMLEEVEDAEMLGEMEDDLDLPRRFSSQPRPRGLGAATSQLGRSRLAYVLNKSSQKSRSRSSQVSKGKQRV